MLKRIMISVCFLGYSIYPMIPYDNTVVSIKKIETNNVFSIILTCSSQSPIVAYDPMTYADHIRNDQTNFFMPRSVLASDLESLDEIIETPKGIIIQMPGKLTSKIVHDSTIILKTTR